jgi:hypothetical protein
VLAALLSVILAGLLWGLLGRVTSTITAPGKVIAANGPRTARAQGPSLLTLRLPADAVQSVRPGMRATFSADRPQGSSPQNIGGSVREVRVVSRNQSSAKGATSNTASASPTTVGLITIETSLRRSRSGASSLPAAGVTGSAEVVTSERRPISLVLP